jgi:hypothetical protein
MIFDRLLAYLIFSGLVILLALAIIERSKCLLITLAEKRRTEAIGRDAAALYARLQREREAFESAKQESAFALEMIAREKAMGFPWLANAYSEYQALIDLKLADALEDKERPAPRAAEQLRVIAKEKAMLQRENRILRALHRYYEDLFPWLIDFQGEDLDELIKQSRQTLSDSDGTSIEQAEEDPAAEWLSQAEQRSDNLTNAEKFQRALDRYWQSKKTPWRVGLDYERYVGYQYEARGFRVEYHGAARGLEDLGRDLICIKDNEIHIVQCKYWKNSKVFHEKHICQLFGTATAYERTQQGQLSIFGSPEVSAWLYTSCSASETAKQFAETLGIHVVENHAFTRYPAVKCNVSVRTGEKIYHLPFDQQYDRTKIEFRDERYVATVAEAESLGFRRAFRWKAGGAKTQE